MASFGTDKRPQFIAFQNQAPLFCSVTVTERGTAAYVALTAYWSQRADTFVTRTIPANDAALQVLLLLLAAHLRIKQDFWVDPISAQPLFERNP
jgi:hypothetical protein